MANISSWISALRPRTLFLAVATAMCGSGLAYSTGRFSIYVCVLTILTATLLQLLSNMANDLGDYEQGTDTTGKRLGPQRTVQSGAITPQEMKRGIYVAISLSVAVGALLVLVALQFMQWWLIALFLALGAAAIWAAVKYTTGKNPYGYRGLGDLFSFIFFGPVPVVGTYFLHTQSFDLYPWPAAIGLGLLSAAVLNINNMRDIDNDRESGKITIPVRIGIANAKIYHTALTIGALVCFVYYNVYYVHYWYQHLYLLAFVLFAKILKDIIATTENKKLDPYLKFTSMSTFLLALMFSILINI